MKVSVQMHGILRRFISGRDSAEIELPEGSCVADLLERLKVEHGELWLQAVNGELAETGRVLRDGDRVDLIPPIGGGIR